MAESRAPRMHVIERRHDGYAPTMDQIRFVLKQAKAQGFRADWDYCGVLEDGSLSFGSSTDNLKVNLIAVKKPGLIAKWKFMTEREYLEAADV